MARLFQYGEVGEAPEFKKFYEFPSMSLQEMREWMSDADPRQAIGIGAVVTPKGTIAGEMVMLGTNTYMIGTDGVAKDVTEDHRVVFAQIAHMAPQKKNKIIAHNMDDLKDKLAELIPKSSNSEAYMVRLSGTFQSIVFRGTDTKGTQFDSLKAALDAPETNKLFPYSTTECQLIGFYSNPGAVSAGVTLDDTLHLHGVDSAYQKGGHVTHFHGPAAIDVEVMPITEWLTSTREAQMRIEYSDMTPRWANRLMRCQGNNCSHSR